MTAPTPERRVGEAELPLAFRVKQALSVLGGADERYNVAIDCLRETAQEVTRLTAEVERLTKEKAEALALADEALALGRVSDDQWCTKEGDRYDRVATRLAALSLPTPAPEGTDGK